MEDIGTRKEFREWLKKHEYTYTAYTKLALDRKREIYRDYQNYRQAKQKGRAA